VGAGHATLSAGCVSAQHRTANTSVTGAHLGAVVVDFDDPGPTM
jgi:hypothetical protein